MKQTTNMARAIGQIQKIARLINQDWFDGEMNMERCIFTVQSTPKAYGHFTPYLSYRVHGADGEREAVEINLGAGTLDRPIEEVVSTLIHEMVHWYNWEHDVKDVSNHGRHHNKRFKAEGERRGLILECVSTIGWSRTSPSEDLLQWVIDNDLEDLRLGRNDYGYCSTGTAGTRDKGSSDKEIQPKKKSSYIRWTCPCCGAIVRSTKVLNLVCGDCNEQFVQED